MYISWNWNKILWSGFRLMKNVMIVWHSSFLNKTNSNKKNLKGRVFQSKTKLWAFKLWVDGQYFSVFFRLFFSLLKVHLLSSTHYWLHFIPPILDHKQSLSTSLLHLFRALTIESVTRILWVFLVGCSSPFFHCHLFHCSYDQFPCFWISEELCIVLRLVAKVKHIPSNFSNCY